MTLFHQAAAAFVLVVVSLFLQCAGVAVLIKWIRSVMTGDIYQVGPIRSATLVVKSTIAIIILHGLVILVWASFYRLHCFASWDLAFYFSGSSYTTVGYGDVVVSANWRLLGPLESMTGMLMCGVSVCLLFTVVTRLVDAEPRKREQPERVLKT
jgi:voltage-gated potassium channel